MTAHAIRFSPYDFASRLLHSVLPYEHPVHTGKGWFLGGKTDRAETLQIAYHLGIDKTLEYRAFVSEFDHGGHREGPLENIHGWQYYDPRKDETVLRVKGIRSIREPDTRLFAGGSDPVSHYENDAMTFIAKGRFEPNPLKE